MKKPLVFAGVQVEEYCPDCGGSGRQGQPSNSGFIATLTFHLLSGWCDSCLGEGVVLNSEGRALAEFMRRHLRTTDHDSLVLKVKKEKSA